MPIHTRKPPSATNGPPKISAMGRIPMASPLPGCITISSSAAPPNRPVHRPDGTRITRPTSRRAMPPALLRGFSGWSDTRGLPEFRNRTVAVEEIVGVEGDDLRLGRDEMDAGSLHRGDTKVIAVEERHDRHPEHLVVAEVVGHLDLGQTAEQVAQHGPGAFAR